MQLQLEEMYSKYNKWKPVKSYLKDLLKGQKYTQEEFNVITHMMVSKRQPIEALVGIYGEEILSTIDSLINNKCLHYQYGVVITVLDIPKELQEELNTFQYPLPNLEEPVFTNNQDSGYITWKKNIILNQDNSTREHCISIINRVSQVPLAVNRDILDIPFTWKGEKSFISKLQKSIDLMLFNNNKFYICHSYDSRGRIYANGYHINYQGIDYQKALIQFHNKEKVTS